MNTERDRAYFARFSLKMSSSNLGGDVVKNTAADGMCFLHGVVLQLSWDNHFSARVLYCVLAMAEFVQAGMGCVRG